MKRKVIALTGGIGSGKSSVANILKQRGFDVLDCDKLARELETDATLLEDVKTLLGSDSVANGILDRRVIRNRIFHDENLHIRYSRLFWDRLQKLLPERIAQNDNTVFVEIAILDAFPFDWSEVWLVESLKQNRIARVTMRDGVSCNNVEDIMSRQPKTVRYTRKIINDGSLTDLQAAVEKALKESDLI